MINEFRLFCGYAYTCSDDVNITVMLRIYCKEHEKSFEQLSQSGSVDINKCITVFPESVRDNKLVNLLGRGG